jgi:hypothetical protein
MTGDGGRLGGWLSLVDRRFFRVALRCPFAVARDLGKNLRTASEVRPGHVAKKLLSMALVQVEMEGLKQARWRNSMRFVFVVCEYALFAWCR